MSECHIGAALMVSLLSTDQVADDKLNPDSACICNCDCLQPIENCGAYLIRDVFEAAVQRSRFSACGEVMAVSNERGGL